MSGPSTSPRADTGAAPAPGFTVLMYHAVGPSGDGGGDPADARYAVPVARFREHLARLVDSGQCPMSVRDAVSRPAVDRGVAMTFDDGHASNAAAAELLAACGGGADFFVNPSTVGTPHFLSWSALREMADQGMSIQSHGWSHRYLDDLPREAVQDELTRSREEIQQRLGRPVTLFAPPGGRQSPGLVALARACGYERVCSSRVDVWRPAPELAEVPRVAVLDATTPAQFDRWILRDAREFGRQRLRHRVLGAAKRVLGNAGYEAVRGLLLKGRGAA